MSSAPARSPLQASSGEPSGCLVCSSSLAGATVLETPDRKRIASGRYRITICPGCGGGTTSPLVAPEDLGGYYESEDYGPHVTGGVMSPLFRLAMRTRLRTTRLFAAMRAMPAGRVLDVGCGRGDLAAALAERGWDAAGLDPSPRACEQARARGIEATHGTIEEVELPGGSYDAIVFHHSLEHVTDPVATLKVAHAALRPGGLVVVGVPNFGSNRARRYGEGWWLLELPRHRFHFTTRALGLALEQGGFEQVSVRETPAMIGAAASLQQRSIGHFLEAGPLFLAGYALNLAAFPFAWASNRVRGGGELLGAVATRPG